MAERDVAPSRGRGSKPIKDHPSMTMATSPPHGGADRNMRGYSFNTADEGRPLTGARIETPCRAAPRCHAEVAPSRGRGSKRAFDLDKPDVTDSRPLTGARIETWRERRRYAGGRWSPPHGGADRNSARVM